MAETAGAGRAAAVYACLVFERFTERARAVVVLAQDEARVLKHKYLGTEHILLGLLRVEEGLAARVLESLDVTAEEVRAEVVRIVGPGEEAITGQIPFTPRAKKVFELALREALSLGHNYIGTEHILLGLVRENEGVAARILLGFDAYAEKVRNEVITKLSGPGRRHEGVGIPGSSAPRRHTKWRYRIEIVPEAGGVTEEQLNELGLAGWELVAALETASELQLVFKRRDV
jgi:ATP-dependent Clp protease ATP-binding subunit ClpA